MQIVCKKPSNYLKLVKLTHLYGTETYSLQKPHVPITYHCFYYSSTLRNIPKSIKIISISFVLDKLAIGYFAR